MRPYIRQKEYKFEYPYDMELIMLYLRAHGEVLVSEATICRLYKDYCSIKCSAGWLRISGLDDPILKDFSMWLDEVEL